MMDAEDFWESQSIEAAHVFAKKCASFRSRDVNAQAVLDRAMNDLMTELWDHSFSQTEIKTAFEEALKDMPRYAAGEEKRR